MERLRHLAFWPQFAIGVNSIVPYAISPAGPGE